MHLWSETFVIYIMSFVESKHLKVMFGMEIIIVEIYFLMLFLDLKKINLENF